MLSHPSSLCLSVFFVLCIHLVGESTFNVYTAALRCHSFSALAIASSLVPRPTPPPNQTSSIAIAIINAQCMRQRVSVVCLSVCVCVCVCVFGSVCYHSSAAAAYMCATVTGHQGLH